jgi:hypothetical protein
MSSAQFQEARRYCPVGSNVKRPIRIGGRNSESVDLVRVILAGCFDEREVALHCQKFSNWQGEELRNDGRWLGVCD